MVIANPIYDVTFKRLLENNKVAKFLIGTILDCKVLSLVPGNPLFTVLGDGDPAKPTIFQMDFTATIVTEDGGEKLVIIEMQKAKDLMDVYRFKRYLGRQYTESELPIISIYILGFDLKSVDSPAFVARPDCRDLMTNEKLEIRNYFVEQLTHRAYFIQTNKIKPSLNTKLEKLLSVFEQANFVGDGKKFKDYQLDTDDPDLKELLDVLNYIASDKEARDALDMEEEAHRRFKGMLGETVGKLAETEEELAETKEALAQKDEVVAQQAEALTQKDEALAKQAAEIEALKKQMEAMKK